MCANVVLPPLFVVWHSHSNVCITELGWVRTPCHEAVIKTWVKLVVECYIFSFHKFVKQFMVLAQMLYYSKITSLPYWDISDWQQHVCKRDEQYTCNSNLVTVGRHHSTWFYRFAFMLVYIYICVYLIRIQFIVHLQLFLYVKLNLVAFKAEKRENDLHCWGLGDLNFWLPCKTCYHGSVDCWKIMFINS